MEIELIDLSGPEHPGPTPSSAPSRRRGLPRRVRATAIVTASAAIALLLITGVALSLRRTQLEHALDRDLTRRAVALERAFVDDPAPTSLDAAAEGEDDRIAQVLQSPGVVVATTPGLDPAAPLRAIVPRPGGSSWTTTDATIAGRVEEVRVAARALATPQGVASSTVVLVGAPLSGIDDELATRRTMLLVITALLVAAVGVATWTMTGRRRATG